MAGLTDEQVMLEIARLTEDEHVKLARREQALKYKQRQYLYTLRSLEKRGKELEAMGISFEELEAMYAAD